MHHVRHWRRVLAVTLGVSIGATACGSSEASTLAARPARGRFLIAAVDISGSRTAAELQESHALLDKAIDRVGNGDKVAVIEMYQGGRAPARQWEDSVAPLHHWPDTMPADRRRAADFRDDAHQTAATFFDPNRARSIQSTDVLGTLFRAADYARAAGARRVTVFVLSDMLNATRELNMEDGRPIPGDSWIAERGRENLLPDLRNACIVVVGADVRTPRGAAVRKFWSRYFTAAGAKFTLANYRNMLSDPSEADCR